MREVGIVEALRTTGDAADVLRRRSRDGDDHRTAGPVGAALRGRLGRTHRCAPTMTDPTDPLFRKIDCLQIPVPDLNAGLAFYRDKLGHELIWRTATAAGLRMPETDAEIVIQTERPLMEANLLVASADEAANRVVDAGGAIVAGPFDIQIGRKCYRRGGALGRRQTHISCLPASAPPDPFAKRDSADPVSGRRSG